MGHYQSVPWRGMRAPRGALTLAVVAGFATLPATGDAETVGALLAAVSSNAASATPVRADVRVECTPACAPASLVLVARGDTLYVEAADGLRALVRPGDVLVRQGERSTAAPPDSALGDTPLLLEDLRVFAADALRVPQISDDGPEGVVVTGAPVRGSVYALLVYTIDRDRHVITKTQYYRDSISNLVKIRRDSGFTKVAGQWRPGEIVVERLRDQRRARLALTWREAPAAGAALFEPKGLEAPSEVTPTVP
jgi:hypothetical protein